MPFEVERPSACRRCTRRSSCCSSASSRPSRSSSSSGSSAASSRSPASTTSSRSQVHPTERTRDFFDQGVLYGSASYIATGRSFDALTSNFVHLYHLYARSHFYFAQDRHARPPLRLRDRPALLLRHGHVGRLAARCVDPPRAVALQPAVLPAAHGAGHFHSSCSGSTRTRPCRPTAARGRGAAGTTSRSTSRAASRARSACSTSCSGRPTWLSSSSCAWWASRTRRSASTTTSRATASASATRTGRCPSRARG